MAESGMDAQQAVKVDIPMIGVNDLFSTQGGYQMTWMQPFNVFVKVNGHIVAQSTTRGSDLQAPGVLNNLRKQSRLWCRHGQALRREL